MNRYKRTALLLVTSFAVLFGVFDPSHAMQPCPPRAEMRQNAQIIVEARLRSLSIGDSALVVTDTSPNRMIRAELEIKRVIKGAFSERDAIAIGFSWPPGPYYALTLMAMLYGGSDGSDTFELELARYEINENFSIYPLNSCIYYKFPDEIEELTGWTDTPSRSQNVPLVDSAPPPP
ncbi:MULTISPECIES: hypothetical protein [unclassified Rhizobium]|uniref:hypothetical protein n=2 Tax=Rhizobium TaxID=379 RepID=UPI0015C8E20C|nr:MULTISPECIES: hypothetical protein [unclassified Rhizobium]MDH7810025.1 hypothetical protein [Rhizobium sp. AN67]